MECPKCNHEDTAEAFGPDRQCPACGAYYDKVIARLNAQAASPAPKAQPKPPSQIAKRLQNASQAVKASKAERAKGSLYCVACGTRSDGKQKARGSTLVELVLWLTFLLPGLIYSVWRLSNKYRACPACGSAELIPIDSPKAIRDMERIK
tara:strand:+ start:334 stop:783 length:450 start_codon:yes stop_codon:yes gene_type:complete